MAITMEIQMMMESVTMIPMEIQTETQMVIPMSMEIETTIPKEIQTVTPM